MPTSLKPILVDFITTNRLNKFFQHWQASIDPSSPLNITNYQLLSDYNELIDNDITQLLRVEEARHRKRELTNGLLQLVHKVADKDLLGNTAAPVKESSPAEESLNDLKKRKLAALERALILSTDAAVKFQLEEQIRALKEGMS
ncbi:MAG: hypothetical protein ACJAZ9_000209 [Neolewinella sp.]|jgi:hypothetical protein